MLGFKYLIGILRFRESLSKEGGLEGRIEREGSQPRRGIRFVPYKAEDTEEILYRKEVVDSN